MKKILIILLLTGFTFGQKLLFDDDENWNFLKGKTIGLLGDSNTLISYLNAEQRWAALLEKRVGATVNNYGSSGKITKNFLSGTLLTTWQAGANDYYIICFGLNDNDVNNYPGSPTYEMILDSFYIYTDSLINSVLSIGGIPILMADGAVDYPDHYTFDKNVGLTTFNTIKETIADSLGLMYIDQFTRFETEINSGNWDLRIRLDGTVDNSLDADHVADGVLWFQNIHYNANGCRIVADEICDVILALTIPTTPTNLVAIGLEDSVSLTWSDVDGEDGYIISRSTGGAYSIIDSTLLNDTTFVDTSNNLSTTYYYKVQSYNMRFNSPYSNADTIIVYPALYVSDWTSLFTGWTTNRATRSANNDGISDGTTSYDDCYKFYADGSTNTHYTIYTNAGITGSTKYQVKFKYYIPSGQTHVDGLKVWFSAGGSPLADYTVVGTWTAVDTTITTAATNYTTWYHNMMDGGVTSFTGANSANDDRIFFKDYSIRQVQ